MVIMDWSLYLNSIYRHDKSLLCIFSQFFFFKTLNIDNSSCSLALLIKARWGAPSPSVSRQLEKQTLSAVRVAGASPFNIFLFSCIFWHCKPDFAHGTSIRTSDIFGSISVSHVSSVLKRSYFGNH